MSERYILIGCERSIRRLHELASKFANSRQPRKHLEVPRLASTRRISGWLIVETVGDPLSVDWPVPPLVTERLVIRPSVARDRPGCIDPLCSAEVRRFLGGALDRPAVEKELPAVPMPHPAHFVVEEGGRFIGTVIVDRRSQSRPGHLANGGHELEISYAFLPDVWGLGYGREAVASVLEWLASVVPTEPVVLCTQIANARSVRMAESLGFAKLDQFEEFGALQWFGVRAP